MGNPDDELTEETGAENAELEETEGTEDAEGDQAADEGDQGEGIEDEESEEGDESLGNRAQKRIKQLVGARKDAEKRVKELEDRLNEAQKLGGDEGKALIAAAETAGILPSMMTKDLAEGLSRLQQKSSALAGISDMLESDDDEFEIGGNTISRRRLERKERELREEVGDLKQEFGPRKRELQQKIKGIFELGLKAQKAGWTGEKAAAKKKILNDKPTGTVKAPAAKKKAGDWGSIGSTSDLERMIAAEMEK